jgi:hypothetical protein
MMFGLSWLTASATATLSLGRYAAFYPLVSALLVVSLPAATSVEGWFGSTSLANH